MPITLELQAGGGFWVACPGGDGRVPWPWTQAGRRRATARDQKAQAGSDSQHLPGPQYIAEELLRSEGFDDVQYVQKQGGKGSNRPSLRGGRHQHALRRADLIRLDAGDPILILAGGHVGCFELIASERVRTIRDLKGKTVTVPELGDATHVYLATIAAYVGLDPQKDIAWVAHPAAEAVQLFTDGKIDVVMALSTSRSGAPRQANWARAGQ